MGPGVNVVRIPQNGRAFEYVSGEDPILGAAMAEQITWGIQNQSVMGCVKHFADNSQEKNRMSVNENVDERTQHELYFPPFEASVNAGVGSAMCSYNKINGAYACANDHQLNDNLRGYMGFKGFVMSDWGAAHQLALSEGLDQEQFMISIPWYYTHRALKKAPIEQVNTSVKRIF
jgi:beta-glucosidase